MNNFFFPIVGNINIVHELLLIEKTKLMGPGDNLISCIASPGGCVNSASAITSTVINLPIKTIVLNYSITFSAAVLIFSAFNERLAFSDSKFLIHRCIPPKNMKRSKIFNDFDLQMFNFISERTKICSLEDVIKIALEEKEISAQRAYDIGLVTKLLKGNSKDYKKTEILKEILK